MKELAHPCPIELYIYGAAIGKNAPIMYRSGMAAAMADADLSPKISTR
jgi:hypothetical protein